MCGPPSHCWSQVCFICLFREVMAAPHVLHAGTPENIFVEIQDCILETNIHVEIIVMNHPTKSRRLASTAVNLNKSNSWQMFGQILVMWTQWHTKLFLLGFSPDTDLNTSWHHWATYPFHLGCPGEGRFLPGRTQRPAGLPLSRPGSWPCN